MAIQWLEWEARQSGFYVQHHGNNKEKKIGKYPVDGFFKRPIPYSSLMDVYLTVTALS